MLGKGFTLAFGMTLLLLVACGSSSVPIDKIAPDKKLTALDSDERQGVCDWAKMVASEKFGNNLNCNGQPISFNSCISVPAACTATVSQWQACIPTFLDRIAANPCVVFQLAFSGLSDFIDQTPGCEGLGPCGTMMP